VINAHNRVRRPCKRWDTPNIVAEFLGLLRPDDRINLKEPRILGIPLPAHHLPILRKVLTAAFTLGYPLHDGRQRVVLDEDNTGMLHALRQGAVCFPRRHSLAQHNTDAQQQATEHEGNEAMCAPRPRATEAACACALRPAREIDGTWVRSETMQSGSFCHTRVS